MKKSNFVLDILYVVSWCLAFLGFLIGFYIFLPISILVAFGVSILLAFPGLCGVVLVELFLIQKDKLNHLNEQTKILKSIEDRLSNGIVSHH